MTANGPRALQDLAILLAPLLGVAALSPVFGLGSGDTVRFTAVFVAVLIPGWLTAARLLNSEERRDPLLRTSLALLLGYLAYGGVALGCRALGLGYAAFLPVWIALAAGGAAPASKRQLSERLPGTPSAAPSETSKLGQGRAPGQQAQNGNSGSKARKGRIHHPPQDHRRDGGHTNPKQSAGFAPARQL